MRDINPTLSVMILNVNRLNIPIKRQNWQNGLKMIQLYSFYKRHTLDSKTQIG